MTFVRFFTLCLICLSCEQGRNMTTGESEPSPTPLTQQILTLDGPVTGLSEEGMRVFKGIPYAAPPIGQLRFEPPQSPEPWTIPLSADAFGEDCLQSDGILSDSSAEDCLTLNIWAPNRLSPKPVMIWIHGGGFTFWSSAFDLFDGHRLAEFGDVVIVSFNYRLGLTGFLPVQDDSFGEKRVLGLLDQQMVFKWVQNNISAFGGDPNNVTVFGESAGGFSICYHLGMPSSDGLFHKAIIQSGGSCSAPKSAVTSREVYEELLRLSGCPATSVPDTLDCLREIEARQLMEIQDELPQNAIGTSLLWPRKSNTPKMDSGANRRLNGEGPQLPILAGSNREEFTFFTAIGAIPAVSDADFQLALDLLELDAEVQSRVREIYSEENYGSVRKAIEAMGTDALFTCPALRFASATSSEEYPVYLYQFRMNLGRALAFVGATHGAEIPYIFDTADAGLLGLPIEIEPEQSVKYQRLWSHFAHHGAPPDELMWAPFDLNQPSMMFFETEWRTGFHEYAERCALVDVDIL